MAEFRILLIFLIAFQIKMGINAKFKATKEAMIMT